MPWWKNEKNLPSSEFGTKFQRSLGSTLFLEIPKFPCNTHSIGFINKKLSYHRGTVRRTMSVEILSYQLYEHRFEKACSRWPWRSLQVIWIAAIWWAIHHFLLVVCSNNNSYLSEILSLISQNLKRSCNHKHVPFGGNLSRVYYYFSVSSSKRNLKCLASLIPKMWLKARNLTRSSASADRLRDMWWFEVVRGHSRSLEIAPFDRAHTSSF